MRFGRCPSFRVLRARDTEEARAAQAQRPRHGPDHLPASARAVLDLLLSSPTRRTAVQIAALARVSATTARNALLTLHDRGLARRAGRGRASKGAGTADLWEAVPE